MDIDPNMAIQMMERGGEFWKYHYRQVGRPARISLRLVGSRDDRALAWKDVGDRDFAASINVADISEIRKGPQSRTFIENQSSIINPNMCFTIYTRGRTLDLEAVHPEDLKIWTAGIKHLLNTAGRFRERDDTNYTYINSRTKEEWMYDGGRMVQPREKHAWDRGHSDIVEDLQRHLEMSCHPDPLDSIEEWLAMKRQTSRALGPPPEPLDVDQWFKAGAFRVDNPCIQSRNDCPPAFPTPTQGQASSEGYNAGYQAGLRAAQQQQPPPSQSYSPCVPPPGAYPPQGYSHPPPAPMPMYGAPVGMRQDDSVFGPGRQY